MNDFGSFCIGRLYVCKFSVSNVSEWIRLFVVVVILGWVFAHANNCATVSGPWGSAGGVFYLNLCWITIIFLS